MLSTMAQNPEGTFVAIMVVITAWPFVIERWNAWRREQFLRNHPSVIIVPKASKHVDLWPTRLAKFVYKNVQTWIMLCCHAILSITVTILRKLTLLFTHKPQADELKPPIAPPKTDGGNHLAPPKLDETAITARVAAHPPPTSVLKRRNPGERRRRDSLEPRVTFTESSNGQVATSYYYYNPSKQANQKSTAPSSAALQQTPVSLQRSSASRLPTPYHFEKQQQRQASKDGEREHQSSLSSFDKENMPKSPSLLYRNHSPGQKQIRAAMEPVTLALRKRRIELENIANASEKRRRIPVTGTRPAASSIVHPNKRRERQQLIWEHLNKRPKKEGKTLPSESNDASQVKTPHSTFQDVATDNAPASTADSAQTSTPSVQFSSSDSSLQFKSLHKDTATLPLGSTTQAPSSSQDKAPRTDGFAFESVGSSTNRNEAPNVHANPSFQFGATERAEEKATASTPSFAFGTTSGTSGSDAPTSSFQFGNPLPSSTSTPAPQPSFKFGSSAENTAAPGPVSSDFFSVASSQQSNQSNSAFHFGGDNVTTAPSFGMSNNVAPSFDASSSHAPLFGATTAQAPMLGMGSPAAATNSARTRRLARRGRRVA